MKQHLDKKHTYRSRVTSTETYSSAPLPLFFAPFQRYGSQRLSHPLPKKKNHESITSRLVRNRFPPQTTYVDRQGRYGIPTPKTLQPIRHKHPGSVISKRPGGGGGRGGKTCVSGHMEMNRSRGGKKRKKRSHHPCTYVCKTHRVCFARSAAGKRGGNFHKQLLLSPTAPPRLSGPTKKKLRRKKVIMRSLPCFRQSY